MLINPFKVSAGGGGPTLPAVYWRLSISANDGDASFTSLGELEMYSGDSRLNRCTGGTATASTEESGHAATRAFNSSLVGGQYWATASGSATPSWLQYQFASPITIDRFMIRHIKTASLTGMPKDFTLQYSNDGVSWATQHTVTGQTAWTRNAGRLFTTASYAATGYTGSPHGTHAYWQIVISEIDSGDNASAAEMEFRATPAGADQSSGGTASAESTFDGTTPASNAFDNNGGTIWACANVQLGNQATWVQYQFGSPVSVGQIAVQARTPSFFSQTVHIGSVRFSDDGSVYSTAWEFTASTWSAAQTQTFTDPKYV